MWLICLPAVKCMNWRSCLEKEWCPDFLCFSVFLLVTVWCTGIKLLCSIAEVLICKVLWRILLSKPGCAYGMWRIRIHWKAQEMHIGGEQRRIRVFRVSNVEFWALCTWQIVKDIRHNMARSKRQIALRWLFVKRGPFTHGTWKIERF